MNKIFEYDTHKLVYVIHKHLDRYEYDWNYLGKELFVILIKAKIN